MAAVQFQIKDLKYQDALDAVAALNGYQATVPDPAFVPDGTGAQAPLIANPVTKDVFLKQCVKNWVQNQMVEYKNRQAVQAVTAQDNTL